MVVFDSAASRSSSSPWRARSDLFAVTTGTPRRSAKRTGSSIDSPPQSSTRRSTSSAFATESGSLSMCAPERSTPRLLPGFRTATRESLSGAPTDSRIRGARQAAERLFAMRLAPLDVAVEERVPGIRLVGFLEMALRVLLQVIHLTGADLIHEVEILAAHPDHDARVGFEIPRKLVHHLRDRGPSPEKPLRVSGCELIVRFTTPGETGLRVI